MSEISEKIERLTDDDLRGLHIGAMVSGAALALELLRPEFAEDDEEALHVAGEFRPMLLAEIDKARRQPGKERR